MENSRGADPGAALGAQDLRLVPSHALRVPTSEEGWPRASPDLCWSHSWLHDAAHQAPGWRAVSPGMGSYALSMSALQTACLRVLAVSPETALLASFCSSSAGGWYSQLPSSPCPSLTGMWGVRGPWLLLCVTLFQSCLMRLRNAPQSSIPQPAASRNPMPTSLPGEIFLVSWTFDL